MMLSMLHIFDSRSTSEHGRPPRQAHAHGLRTRRLDRRARKVLAACCAALAVLCTLECVVTATATRDVLTASREIHAGDAVVTSDFIPAAVPVNDALERAVDHLDDGTNAASYALIDIRKGDVLLPTMLTATPAVATGHTVIDVRIGELNKPFAPGTHIALTAATGCSPPETGDGNGEVVGEGLCMVSADAIVMGAPRDDAATGGSLTPVAMPAADAMRTLQAQETGPILAIRAAPATADGAKGGEGG